MGTKNIEQASRPAKRKRTGRQENLVPLTTEKAREIGRIGGIRSGEAKKEKKLMSAIYAEFLAKKHKIKIPDVGEIEVDGDELMGIVAREILDRGDSASVSLMKEIREATEGNKITLEGSIDIANMSPDERKKRIEELKKELHGTKE